MENSSKKQDKPKIYMKTWDKDGRRYEGRNLKMGVDISTLDPNRIKSHDVIRWIYETFSMEFSGGFSRRNVCNAKINLLRLGIGYNKSWFWNEEEDTKDRKKNEPKPPDKKRMLREYKEAEAIQLIKEKHLPQNYEEQYEILVEKNAIINSPLIRELQMLNDMTEEIIVESVKNKKEDDLIMKELEPYTRMITTYFSFLRVEFLREGNERTVKASILRQEFNDLLSAEEKQWLSLMEMIK